MCDNTQWVVLPDGAVTGAANGGDGQLRGGDSARFSKKLKHIPARGLTAPPATPHTHACRTSLLLMAQNVRNLQTVQIGNLPPWLYLFILITGSARLL